MQLQTNTSCFETETKLSPNAPYFVVFILILGLVRIEVPYRVGIVAPQCLEIGKNAKIRGVRGHCD